MILIAGPIHVQEGKMAEAKSAVIKMAVATRKEAGCVAYSFYEDMENPNQLFLFEEWETPAHLKAHGNTPHMAEFRKAAPNFMTGPRELVRYGASSKKPL